MALSTKLKEYREAKGLKQADLAELVGVRRETIVNLEKGKYNPVAGNGHCKRVPYHGFSLMINPQGACFLCLKQFW